MSIFFVSQMVRVLLRDLLMHTSGTGSNGFASRQIEAVTNVITEIAPTAVALLARGCRDICFKSNLRRTKSIPIA